MTSPREWDAATYHRVSAPQLRWGEAVVDSVDLRGEELAVDAGCGTGRVSARLLQRLPRGRVIGVDLSRSMLATAARTLDPARFAAVQADLVGLPLRSGCADVVLSTATFHWIPDHDRLFAEIARVLRPGGRLVAQWGGRGNIARAHAHADAVAAAQPWGGAFASGRVDAWNYPGPEETVARLRAAGFEGEARLHDEPTPFAGAAAYGEFMQAVVLRPWLNRLPSEDARARFTAQVVERAGADDPPYTLDYVRITARAVRRE